MTEMHGVPDETLEGLRDRLFGDGIHQQADRVVQKS